MNPIITSTEIFVGKTAICSLTIELEKLLVPIRAAFIISSQQGFSSHTRFLTTDAGLQRPINTVYFILLPSYPQIVGEYYFSQNPFSHVSGVNYLQSGYKAPMRITFASLDFHIALNTYTKHTKQKPTDPDTCNPFSSSTSRQKNQKGKLSFHKQNLVPLTNLWRLPDVSGSLYSPGHPRGRQHSSSHIC